MDKKKNIIIVVLLLIVGVLAYFAYSFSKELFEVKTNNTNNYKETNIIDDKTNENNTNEEQKIEGAHILTDFNLKDDISKKASIIITLGESDSTDAILTFYSSWTYKITEFTDGDKIDINLNYNKRNTTVATLSDLKLKTPNIYKEFKKEYDSDTKMMESLKREDLKIISGEEIEKSYKDLFNTDIPAFDKNNPFLGYCPSFEYDSQTNYYLQRNNCGGINYPTYYIYKDKYIIDNDTITVDAYVAVRSSAASGQSKVYKGIEENESNYLYTEKNDSTIKNDLKLYPNKYQLYQLIFKKNSEGNYYYETTKKID